MSDRVDSPAARLSGDHLPAVIVTGSAGVGLERAHSRTASRLDNAISAGIFAALAVTALTHGAVEPWSVAIFELIIIALILMWAVKSVNERRLTINVPNAALPLIALLALGVVQSLATTDSSGLRASLSMDVEATRGAVTVLFFLVVSFFMAATFFVNRERFQTLVSFLAVYGLAMAVFALVQHFTWDGKFYWIRPNTQSASPFGPFVNHNHFAGYMEMLLPVPLAVAVTRGVRHEARIFYGFAAAVMGISAITSLSRGGMLSLIAGLLFIAVMSGRVHPERANKRDRPSGRRSALDGLSRPAAVVAIVVAMGAGVLWIGPDAVIERVTGKANNAGETFFGSRGWIWRDTVSMIKANPAIGVGLGAYQTAYSIYSRSDGSLLVGYAHNDYLQILADGGIIGAAIALWFIVAIFRAVGRGLRQEDPLIAGVALGSGAAIFSILVHSVIDFNLQLPSNALLFLVLAAVAAHIGSLRKASE